MQQKTTRQTEEAKRVGLEINTTKTKVMEISGRYDEIIHIDNREIDDVDKFVYLGARVSKTLVVCRS